MLDVLKKIKQRKKNLSYRDYYFIDYENLHQISLKEIDAIHTKIYILVGDKQNRIPFELVSEAQKFGVNLEWIKIDGVSRNNLDFHICFLMGAVHNETPQSIRFFLISKDKGFDPIVRYINKKGRKCFRIDQLTYEGEKANYNISNGNIPNTSESVELMIDNLKKIRPVKRPRKVKTLKNYIKAATKNDNVEEIFQTLVDKQVFEHHDMKINYKI